MNSSRGCGFPAALAPRWKLPGACGLRLLGAELKVKNMAHGQSGKSWVAKIRGKQAARHWSRPLTVKAPDVIAVQSAIKQLRGEQLDKASYLKRLNELLKGENHGERQQT